MSHHSRKISPLLLLCFPFVLFAATALGQGINEVSSLPIITTHPRGGVFDSGSSILLRCQAQNANLSPVFTHNGVLIDERDPIRNTSTEGLSISNFSSAFEGEYVCLVRNLVGNITFTVASAPALVQLRVLEATLFSSELSAPHNVTIRVGQPAIIDCASNYISIPAPIFDWRLRRPFARSLALSDNMVIGLNGSLYIRNPILSQNLWVLECTITNGGQLIMSGYIQLIVDSMSSPAASPQILSPPRDVALVFNQDMNAHFECIVGGSPLQPVTWITSVPEERYFANPVFDNNQIQVALQESDAGAMFTCSVATVGNFSAQLTFIDPPRLTNGLRGVTQVTDYGSPLSLSCSSDSLAITWYWFRNGTRLNEFSGPQLSISSTVEEDNGSYQCYAINDAGIASSQTYVQVRTIAASITSSLPPQQIIFIDSPFSLGCSATGAPPPTYQWIKDGVPLAEISAQFQVDSNTGSLTIASVDNTFNGNYTCRASNRIVDRVIGQDEISTTLTIITPTTFTQSIDTEPMLSILLEAKDTLFCDVSHDSGSLLQFSWTKDNQSLVVDGTRLRYVDPSLTRSGSINITRVLSEDAGVYVCTVTTTYNGLPAPTIRTRPSQVVVTDRPMADSPTTDLPMADSPTTDPPTTPSMEFTPATPLAEDRPMADSPTTDLPMADSPTTDPPTTPSMEFTSATPLAEELSAVVASMISMLVTLTAVIIVAMVVVILYFVGTRCRRGQLIIYDTPYNYQRPPLPPRMLRMDFNYDIISNDSKNDLPMQPLVYTQSESNSLDNNPDYETIFTNRCLINSFNDESVEATNGIAITQFPSTNPDTAMDSSTNHSVQSDSPLERANLPLNLATDDRANDELGNIPSPIVIENISYQPSTRFSLEINPAYGTDIAIAPEIETSANIAYKSNVQSLPTTNPDAAVSATPSPSPMNSAETDLPLDRADDGTDPPPLNPELGEVTEDSTGSAENLNYESRVGAICANVRNSD